MDKHCVRRNFAFIIEIILPQYIKRTQNNQFVFEISQIMNKISITDVSKRDNGIPQKGASFHVLMT